MSSRFIFQPEARREFFEAISRYENERPGLGREFAREVVHAMRRARLQPDLFRKVRGRARKIRLRRFRAYSIYFAEKDDIFSIIAVFHGARNPDDLTRRLE